MRTRIIALLLASAGLAVTTSACRMGEENQAEQAQGSASGINLAAMDKGVKPGDDFFLYANGNWFKPGGWLHERFGMEGAVLAVRAKMGLVALLVAGYFVWTVYRLTGGLKARRAQIAETYDVFDPPDQPRQR